MNEKERRTFRESKWKKLTRQRWFYPTLYITLVTVVLAGVLIYQMTGTDEAEQNDHNWQVEQNDLIEHQEQNADEAEPVVADQEDLVLPVLLGDRTEIITNFYDVNASAEEQEDALIFYNNRYYQSQGVDITSTDGEPFEVIAALSGTVVEVKEDQLLGQTVEIEHEGERMTVYASLSEIDVEAGDEVSQGDKLGVSGENVYSGPDVSKVHFQLIEDGEPVNPGFQ
ncbi:stage II sporulation protein Q [Alkalibacillus filiformis]|uniref:Stage II sporulation protein Q n=1 Tax=Alkalibacillus filiformis TaxID=200990 RepID=A0ABU0DW65_9BACI|nr:M23 family metallopeptidase [Alkalibacillus filiformis]MDQ0352702.1 stage II sporulation protein Q [Alkalibacillus filiformis]